MRQDIRLALRLLLRDRGFTVLAALALGLGIGVNSTFFSLVNAAVLRGLPIEAADDVVFLSLRDVRNVPRGLTLAQFDELRVDSRTFVSVGAYTSAPVTIGDDGRPLERVGAASVSATAWPVLGVAPRLGRTFRADDDRVGAGPVAVIGYRLWQVRYGGQTSVLGRSVTLNDVRATIVGVMPDGFQFPGTTDVWTTLTSVSTPPSASAPLRLVSVFGRLAPGRTAAHAEVEFATFRARWARDSSSRLEGYRASVVPINRQFFGSLTDTVWLAFITAGVLVLLIACANVANLLLMRAAAREREVVVRMSLGATRGRIVRQLLIESALLAALGAVVGLAFTAAGLQMLQMLVPAEVALLFDFTLDVRVAAALVGASAASVFLFGLAPALHLVRRPAGEILKDGGRGSGSAARQRWATAFLAAEFALTLVLLANIANNIRSVDAAREAQTAIDPAPILTMSLVLPDRTYGVSAARSVFLTQFVEAVAAIPSVSAVSLASVLPESGAPLREVTIAGRQSPSSATAPRAATVLAGERYFETLGLPLVTGRSFTAADGAPGQDVAVVNARFAELFLLDADPLGVLIRIAAADGDVSAWLRVVGVAPSIRQSSQDGVHPDPVVYLPVAAAAPRAVAVLVRTTGNPAALAAPIRDALGTLDSRLPLDRVMTMTDALRQAQWNGRISQLLLNGIGTIALVLALVGLYAVTAHSVRLRRKELGIRIALGATQRTVGTLVLQRALVQLAVGLVAGIGATYAFDRFFVTSTMRLIDPVVLIPTMAAIALVGTMACLVPASRAANVEPVLALRDE